MASNCTEAYHELDIHMSDTNDRVTARNCLITQVILASSFDPESPSDCQYLWDLWYDFQWTEATRKRFVSDVKKLLKNQLSNPSIITHGANFDQKLQKILRSWINTASNMTASASHEIVKKRYIINYLFKGKHVNYLFCTLFQGSVHSNI